MSVALGLWNLCREMHATTDGIGIGGDGGREEEDVSHRNTAFNHSHTTPKQAESDLSKTVLFLLKVVMTVSAFDLPEPAKWQGLRNLGWPQRQTATRGLTKTMERKQQGMVGGGKEKTAAAETASML
ncbi:hypothetical protein K438DRAFT_1762860 [Mycena galopus ATCC 62051]|nr:hypothetical protein K438DRAFT_1762860 [Mycena galopus ATCC 62051]